jgi:NitT/TauT family transport system ATP-binding protein
VALHQDVYEIVRSQGITTILVTHDLAEAISLSDKVYILTARPARVFRGYDIPFGRDREMMSLREHRDFLDLYGTLWQDLHSQIESDDARDGRDRPARDESSGTPQHFTASR